MDTGLAQNLDTAGKKARYDRCAKKIIGYKAICAWILKTCTEEFALLDVGYIAGHCISDVTISEKAVHQDHMDRKDMLSGDDRITGLNSESPSVKEGTIYYDVRFMAFAPGSNELIGLIINIEVQNDPVYHILPRAEYYCARMLSEQYGTVFKESQYHRLEKVYSIWICPDQLKKQQNGIFRFPRTLETICGIPTFRKKDYDKSEYIIIIAGKPDDPGDSQIIDLLYTVFSDDMSVSDKKKRLSSVYGIEMTKEIETEVHEMCNLSEAIASANLEKGRGLGRAEGHAEGIADGIILANISMVDDNLLTVEKAAERSGVSVEEFLRKKEEFKRKGLNGKA